MLIITSKHTVEDLSIWDDYEISDRIHSESKGFDQKIERVKSIIINFVKNHDINDYYIACSWGKDSVVLLHLWLQIEENAMVVYFNMEDRNNPDVNLVKERLVHLIRNYKEIYYGFDYPGDFYGIKILKLEDACKANYIRVTGIRNDESGKRLMRYKAYNEQSKKTFAPLSLLNASDIFAYLHKYKLPVCPVYGYLGGGRWDRHKLRTHILHGKSGDGIGRSEWEWEYYPEEMRRIRQALHMRK